MCIEKKQPKSSIYRFTNNQFVHFERKQYDFWSMIVSALVTTLLLVITAVSGNYYSSNPRRDYELKIILFLAGISTYITFNSFQKYSSYQIKPITEEERQQKYQEMVMEADAEKRVQISRAAGTAESIQRISEALRGQPYSQTVLKFLIAQQFVEANLKLASSENSKVVFLDPKLLTESISELVGETSDLSS